MLYLIQVQEAKLSLG